MSEPMVSIHNRFRVEVRDAVTEELLQEAFGENMVLDRIYTRLLQFNTYFVNIVFGIIGNLILKMQCLLGV